MIWLLLVALALLKVPDEIANEHKVNELDEARLHVTRTSPHLPPPPPPPPPSPLSLSLPLPLPLLPVPIRTHLCATLTRNDEREHRKVTNPARKIKNKVKAKEDEDEDEEEVGR
ncbi:hypothetical protein V1478_008924 [Vespula squamosa]|uniref:Uncharacterized protein n=1 Tax=Vespula squamosa TaxID=30214 RepID=A0ABD2AUW8_VESSQ